MIYVFDIDGTICFDREKIDKNILANINKLKRKGETLIFASSRPIRDLLPVVKSSGSNILIGGNGSIVLMNGEVFIIDYIKVENFKKIKQLISKYNLQFIVNDKFNYSSNITSENDVIKQLDPDNVAENVEIETLTTVIKIMLFNIPESIYRVIKNEVLYLQSDISVSFYESENSIDIVASGINKYTSLIKYIGTDDYIAFGNDKNDTELLKNARIGYFIGDVEYAQELGLETVKVIPKNSYLISAMIENYV